MGRVRLFMSRVPCKRFGYDRDERRVFNDHRRITLCADVVNNISSIRLTFRRLQHIRRDPRVRKRTSSLTFQRAAAKPPAHFGDWSVSNCGARSTPRPSAVIINGLRQPRPRAPSPGGWPLPHRPRATAARPNRRKTAPRPAPQTPLTRRPHPG